jgi:hypothetical protein
MARAEKVIRDHVFDYLSALLNAKNSCLKAKHMIIASSGAYLCCVTISAICLVFVANVDSPGEWILASALFSPLALSGWLLAWSLARIARSIASCCFSYALLLLTLLTYVPQLVSVYGNEKRIGETVLIVPGVLGIKLMWTAITGIIMIELLRLAFGKRFVQYVRIDGARRARSGE